MDGNTSPFGDTRLPTQRRVRQIWAVGGGKGGVGKSLLSSSLAISLSRTGNKVLAVDLDLGGANLHTTLGVELPRQTLNDFFSERSNTLDACVAPTSIPNLEFISGAQDSVSIANVPESQKAKFLNAIRDVDADYVIFDLGAGTSSHTLDFFLAADINIVTLLPEPTSIENGYRFLKSAYFRRLWMSPKLHAARQWIEIAMDAKNNEGIRSPSDLFKVATRENPELAMALKAEIERFRPKLILNQVRTHSDIEIGFSVKTVCKKYFGVELDYLGYLDYDSAVWQAIRRKRPVMLEFPNSKLVTSIDRLVDYLLKKHSDSRSSVL